MSDEQKAKISMAEKGRSTSLETRAKISAAKLGHHPSLQARANQSAAQMGHVFYGPHLYSAETRAKMSLSHRGQVMPEVTRLALRKANLGRHPTDEQRINYSRAHIGHVESEEQRAKISAAGKGKPKSDAWRAKMSVRQKANPGCNSDACRDAAYKAHLGSHMSNESRMKMSATHQGCLLSDWEKFTSSESLFIRHSSEYTTWRTAVFKRDNYTCQECGERSGKGHKVILEAHHIHEFAEYPELRFDVDNGNTLCRKCHHKTRQRKARVAA
jgi:hypothetical protein